MKCCGHYSHSHSVATTNWNPINQMEIVAKFSLGKNKLNNQKRVSKLNYFIVQQQISTGLPTAHIDSKQRNNITQNIISNENGIFLTWILNNWADHMLKFHTHQFTFSKWIASKHGLPMQKNVPSMSRRMHHENCISAYTMYYSFELLRSPTGWDLSHFLCESTNYRLNIDEYWIHRWHMDLYQFNIQQAMAL